MAYICTHIFLKEAINVLCLLKPYGAVTYKWIKIQMPSGQKICKNCLSGDGSHLRCGEDHRRSHKERIRTEQVTDNERSTNARVTDV